MIPAQPGWFVRFSDEYEVSLSVVAWTTDGDEAVPMVLDVDAKQHRIVRADKLFPTYSILEPHQAYEYCTTSGAGKKAPDGDWEAIGFATDSDGYPFVLWRRPHKG